MKYLLLSTITLSLLTSSLSGQSNVLIDRKDFKTDKPGFDVAWKHIREGDNYYKDGGIWYSNAFYEYSQAYTYNNASPELNYKIGVSALFSDKKDEAADFLLRSYSARNDIAGDILFLIGKAQQYAGKYQEALDRLNAFMASPVKKKPGNVYLANKAIEECTSALEILKDTGRVEISNIGGNINSGSDDYSITFTSDGQKMYFASRRALKAKSKSHFKDDKFDENIYSSDFMRGTWTLATIAGKNLITEYCETPLYINNGKDKLYLYAGYEGEGNIQVSESKKGEWKKPSSLDIGINSKYPETSFCMSPSEEQIAFVSNRGRHGEGGKDIWVMEKKSRNKWSKARNAGPGINSSYDEESVRFSKGGDTLWFSSAGHNTIGGFDIFYSVRNSMGIWGQSVNAGYPVNTPWNELFYVPSPVSDSSFFFVSDRSGGFGGLDIYNGKILPPPPPPKPPVKADTIPSAPVVPVIIHKPDTVFVRDTVVIVREIAPVIKDTVKVARDTIQVMHDTIVAKPALPKELILFLTGSITDAESGSPILARIDIIDLKTNQVVSTTASSDVDGSYRVKMTSKGTFLLDLRATGFLDDMKKVTIPETYTEELFRMNMTLNKVKVGKKVILNNILFQLGKSILTTGSYSELDKLVKMLEDNPGMKIEISGHTDNTGSPVVNAKLSTERARAVVDYLVQKGISSARLTYRGYGSDQPITENNTEAGRSKNRRVEFKILEF
jgi:outer membrane protein OmpA-like peptidoglycan-associated protein